MTTFSRQRISRYLVVALLIINSLPLEGRATTLFVSPTGNMMDGLSWPTAYNRVGDAVANATGGDQIWVASGTYNEAIELATKILLYGGFSGVEGVLEERDFQNNITTLDAEGLKSSVVRIRRGADNSHIDGFTVTHGDPTGVTGGGGFNVAYASCSISNCQVAHNRAFSTSPEIIFGAGGGMTVLDSDVVISDCVFRNNITNNGGGIIFVGSSGIVRNSLFVHNVGAAVEETGSNIILDSCTFGLGNRELGSGLLDISPGTGGGPNGGFFLTNCVTRVDRITGHWSRLHVSYSNIPDIPNVTGPGNIDADPLWVDPENGDYRLRLGSPCIDSGSRAGPIDDLDGNSRPVDVSGLGHDGPGAFDMGVYEFQLSPADLDANGSVNANDLFEFQRQWFGAN